MRRFLLHVLPSGFHRIRHYGFLANANRKHDIATARELLHQPAPTPPADPSDGSADHGCPDPPSCAGTAAPRCSSSRPSRVLSTSAVLRTHRPRHDRHRVNQRNFSGGIFLNDAVANARGLVLQNLPVLAPQSPLERPVPLRAWLVTETHRSRSPDYLRLTDFNRRSNPHRSATLLIGISTSPRFPPWRLVQHLPPSLTGLGQLSAHRQVSDNP